MGSSGMNKRSYKSLVFMAVLVGFPISNVLIFLSTQFSSSSDLVVHPRHPGEVAELGLPPIPGAHPRSGGASSHEEGLNDSGFRKGVIDKVDAWPLLEQVVKDNALYNTYESFYNSGSQSWRIKKYGTVCIVADAFLGAVVSSGTGTALTTLAETLASNGFEVTLLYTPGREVETATVDFWVQYYSSHGIKLVPLPTSPTPYDVPIDIEVSHRVYVWLSQQAPYDAIHFPDNRGRAYFTLVAKRQGINFGRSRVVLHAHSPHLWYKMNSLQMINTIHDLILDHLERQSVLMADQVVSPSVYMANWMLDNGWQVSPERMSIHPHILPGWVQKQSRVVMQDVAVVELVFFGRLELKKGVVLFCDMLDQLARDPAKMEGMKVTFLGRLPEAMEERMMMRGGLRVRMDDYIKQRAKKWKFPWQILKDMDAQARMDYMRSGARLAVLPSLMENSPYTVYECLVAGVPFLTHAVGGVPELIHPDDHARVLVDGPNGKALARRILQVLQDGLRPARPWRDVTPDKTWVVWHHMMMMDGRNRDQIQNQLASFTRPKVSICIVTYNNPSTLKQAIMSIEEQEYHNYELVVVDDGSTAPDAVQYLEELQLKFAARGWHFRRQENRGPGAARNHAAQLATGDWLMFMDDDNYAKPHELRTFVDVAHHTGADVLTCSNDYFVGDSPPTPDYVPRGRWVPLGAATTVGMFQNMYGDTNAMIKKEVFLKLGGFPEDFGYALEDWELFSKVVLSGYKLETIPDPLYWYRLRETSHSRMTAKQGNPARTIRPYLKKIPQHLHHLVLFAQGMKDAHDVVHLELEQEQTALGEMRKMLKALANTLKALCAEGKLPEHSRNLLVNPQFATPGGVAGMPVQGWRTFGAGYVHDALGGRIGYGALDSFALRMTNGDWRDSAGATQTLVLNQEVASAVVVSGWSRADKVSGSADSGYAIYTDIAFADGSKMWGYTISFDTGTHGWQFKAGVIDPTVPIQSLQLYTMFRWHSGSVWFDDLAVNKLTEGLCDYTQLTLEGLGDADAHPKGGSRGRRTEL